MLECYEEAAELFDGEDQKGETRNCKLKIAHYKALMEQKEATSKKKKKKKKDPGAAVQKRVRIADDSGQGLVEQQV